MLSEVIFRAVFGGLAGATFASFAAASAVRLTGRRNPLVGQSVCDHCETPLGWGETLPVASYVRLMGRCRTCREAISSRYVFSEAAGAAAGALTLSLAPVYAWAPLLGLMGLLVHAAAYDVLTLRIRDEISLATLLLGACIAFTSPAPLAHVATSLAASVTLSLAMLFYRRLRTKAGLGFGDVKLLAGLCLAAGPVLSPLGIAVASGLALGWMVLRKPEVGKPLPFAPFIALAFWPAILGEFLA